VCGILRPENLCVYVVFYREMVNISHAVGVVSRYMEKPGEEHGNGCFKHISKSITYNGCGDLVCGYDS
jgi:hypothetical protein